ncbi:hypothetical protein F4776DRAFT_619225 [Hypoxylon sp. NC0597]|nr:hypothetical protein F4776DRAFT_619225 [Hypoxylon sp. NC0597]
MYGVTRLGCRSQRDQPQTPPSESSSMSNVSTSPHGGTGCSSDRVVQISFFCLCPYVCMCVSLYKACGRVRKVVSPRCAAASHASQPGSRAETGSKDGRLVFSPSMRHFHPHTKEGVSGISSHGTPRVLHLEGVGLGVVLCRSTVAYLSTGVRVCALRIMIIDNPHAISLIEFLGYCQDKWYNMRPTSWDATSDSDKDWIPNGDV